MTKLSKWIIYLSSYLPVYIIYLISIIISLVNQPENRTIYTIAIIVVSIALIVSIVLIITINKKTPNSRVYSKIHKNSTGEMLTFLVPYIISFIALNFDIVGCVSMVLVFILGGLVVINSEHLCWCPAFLFSGYKVYKNAESKYILSRMTKDRINLMLEETSNGIEVVCISENLYLIP